MSIRILALDDDPDTAAALRDFFEARGDEVRAVGGGPEAARLADEWQPDVIFCDVARPALDSAAVTRAVRRDPRLADTVLIALSSSDSAAERARAAGFNHHLTKPAGLHEMLQFIAERPTPAAAR